MKARVDDLSNFKLYIWRVYVKGQGHEIRISLAILFQINSNIILSAVFASQICWISEDNRIGIEVGSALLLAIKLVGS